LCSELSTTKYGLQISPISNLREGGFIELHDDHIRDIAENCNSRSLFATVSVDRSIAITDVGQMRVLKKKSCPKPLCCGLWKDSYVIAVGGNEGMIGFYDSRADDLRIFDRHLAAPVTALTLVSDDRMLVLSPVESRFFDLRQCRFEAVCDSFPRARFVRSCRQFDYHVITTTDGTIFFTKYRRSANDLIVQRCKTLKPGYGTARPAVAAFDNLLYSAFSETADEFSLYAMTRPDIDIWARFKDGFVRPRHDSQLLDLAVIHENNDLLVFALSRNFLEVIQIPQ
jgi:hypothetical protein